MIGIQFAMEEEANSTIDALEKQHVKLITHGTGTKILLGELGGVRCAVGVSGMGKIAATHCATALVTSFDLDMMLNVGFAGSTSGLSIGSIVVGTRIVQWDLLEMLGSSAIHDMDTHLAHKTASALHPLLVKYGTIGCGDRFVRCRKDIPDSIDCVDMESAAIHQTCARFGIPFTAVKVISDQANCDAPRDFTDSTRHQNLLATLRTVTCSVVSEYGN